MRWSWLLILTSCTSTATSNISAQLVGTLQDDGSLALNVQLLDFSNPTQAPQWTAPPYVLEGGESLRATFHGQTTTLVSAADRVGPGAYYASFTGVGEVAADEPITLTFDRGGEQVTFGVTTTADFVLSAPASTPPPVTVTWTPSTSDPMSWVTSGCNNFEADGPIPHDMGRIDFPPGVLAPPTAQDPCSATISFSRTRTSAPQTSLSFAFASFTRGHHVVIEVTP